MIADRATLIALADIEAMAAWASGVMERQLDFVIGAPAYLRRWFVVPRNAQQNIYLHEILRDDDDRAPHDHPWENVSYVLRGWYREVTPEGSFVREEGQKWDVQHTDTANTAVQLALARDAAEAEVAALTKERDALREALTPFAAVADEYDDREDDSFEVWQDAGPVRTIRATFELRKYRAARAALNAGGERG